MSLRRIFYIGIILGQAFCLLGCHDPLKGKNGPLSPYTGSSSKNLSGPMSEYPTSTANKPLPALINIGGGRGSRLNGPLRNEKQSYDSALNSGPLSGAGVDKFFPKVTDVLP